MYALTLAPWWAWAVVHGSKDVENRGWTNAIVDDLVRRPRPFAIHAGSRSTRTEYEAAVDEMREADPLLVVPPLDRLALGAILGIAEIERVWTPFEWSPHRRWHRRGLCGWQLRERRALRAPLFCKGRQGFWTISDEAVARAGGPLP